MDLDSTMVYVLELVCFQIRIAVNATGLVFILIIIRLISS